MEECRVLVGVLTVLVHLERVAVTHAHVCSRGAYCSCVKVSQVDLYSAATGILPWYRAQVHNEGFAALL